ncbi:MAG: discoidin domain-containing protein [Muribaculaceae bacterium]|nr:discoidin domain-containing protein [Muribaculaceae bacterium]
MAYPIKRMIMAVAAAVAVLPFAAAADNSYLDRSSWSWSASSTDQQDGGGTAAICDGNYSTFWHSNYHEDASRNCPHWILIDRGSDRSEFVGLSYVPRQGAYNNLITQYRIYLSDKSFGNISSVSESVLGSATYSGYFDGQEDYSERTAAFGKSHSERYVLFVVDNCNSGRSTAISELYLLSGVGSSGGQTPSGGYNSVLIHNYDGSDHRIAIDGDALNVCLSPEGAVHLSNSGITIEYEIPEVSYFAFENYDFPDDTYYIGSKRDLNAEPAPEPEPFDLVVTPADGSVHPDGFTSISFAHPEGVELEVKGTSAVLLKFGVVTVYRWNAEALAEAYDAATHSFTFSGLDCMEPGSYNLTVPSSLFVEKENPIDYNNQLMASFRVSKGAGIDDARVKTLGFSVEGGRILIRGISAGREAMLFTVGGSVVAQAPVTPFGTAAVDVSSLAHGAYVLRVDGKSFKITI